MNAITFIALLPYGMGSFCLFFAIYSYATRKLPLAQIKELTTISAMALHFAALIVVLGLLAAHYAPWLVE